MHNLIQRLSVLPSNADRGRLLAEWHDQVDPDELIRRLKGEAEQSMNDNPLRSLGFAEALLTVADRTGRPEHRALGLMATGDALQVLGRYHEAVPVVEEAAAIFARRDDEIGWARCRIGLLWPMHFLGRADEALPVASRSIDFS